MPDLPKVRQEYEADTRGYSGPLREAAKEADRFGDKNSKAALAARKMGLAAKEAADKAARSMSLAGEAAEKLAMGEIKADEAAQAEARALRDMERAAIAAAEAEHAVARAANEAAQQERQAARDAELAGAAQRLAALKAAGAVKQHNAVLKDLEGRFGDLSKEGGGAFQSIETDIRAASTQLAGMGPAVTVGVVNALALLPEAATVAGEGIVLGLGGALTAVGLKAQAGYADVRRTFSKLKTDVSGDLKEISGPFHETWLRLAADADHAFHELEPSLQDAFSRMAPAVSHFESTIISGLSGPRVQAAIASIGRSFGPILDALGPATASAIGDVADGIKSIADAAARNPGALAGLVTGIGQITKAAMEGVGFLIKYKQGIENLVMMASGGGPLGLYKLVNALNDGTRAILGVDDGFTQAERTFPTFSQQATAAAAASGHLMTANQAAALSADQLKTAMDNLTGKTLTERESMVQYRQAITQLNQSLKENGERHGFATAKGAANEQALDGLAIAAQKTSQAMKDDGKSAQEVSTYLEGARRRLIAAAEKMGYTSGQARDLASKLLGVTHAANTIPSGKRITLTDNTSSVRAHIAALQRSITNLHGKTVTVDYIERVHRTVQAERADLLHPAKGGYIHRAVGGPVRWYPDGGRVSGPGTGTSDSIPAMISNGEFVVNAKQTAKWLPLLESINAGVEGFASGGAVKTPAQLLSAMASAQKKEATYRKDEAKYRKLYAKYHKEYLAHHTATYRKAQAHALAEEAKYRRLAAEQAALYKKYQAQYDAIGRPDPAARSPLPAKLRNRPEYQAATAVQGSLEAMRASIYGGFFRGGPPTLGSAHGSVVQHITTVNVHVAGSIRSDRELAQVVQRQLITNRMPVSLPGGRL